MQILIIQEQLMELSEWEFDFFKKTFIVLMYPLTQHLLKGHQGVAMMYKRIETNTYNEFTEFLEDSVKSRN